MTRIEELEKLRERWKAAEDAAAEVEKYYEAECYLQRVVALDAALAIFKRPSNTQMQIDTKADCDYCKGWSKIGRANFCERCGRPLSD